MMVRRTVTLVTVTVGLLAAAAAPAVAARPPPQNVPGLVAVVRDACTRARVAGLSVTLTDPTTGAVSAPDKVVSGKFVFNTMPPGPPARLQVSAPGYQPLGDAATPGIDVTSRRARPPCRHRKRSGSGPSPRSGSRP